MSVICRCDHGDHKGAHNGEGDCFKCGRPLKAPVDRRRPPSAIELERREKISKTLRRQRGRNRVA